MTHTWGDLKWHEPSGTLRRQEVDDSKRIAELESRNAALGQLVRDMYGCIELASRYPDEKWICDYCERKKENDGKCGIWVRIMVLGIIEVD